MNKIIARFLFFLLAGSLAAQTATNVTTLTVNDGLSEGMIFDILQSRDGYIWIATKDGLNRYDGARFEVFSHDTFDPFSIANNEVKSIFEDSRGWIWLVFESGLDVFDAKNPGRFYHVTHDGNNNFGGVKPWVSKISESPDGVIWFKGTDGIWKLNVSNDLLARSAQKGASIIEPPYKMIPQPPFKDGGAVGKSKVLFKDNTLLFVTDEGLVGLDPATEKILPALPTPDWRILSFSVDAQGRMIVLTDNLSIYDYQTRWIWNSPTGTQSFLDKSTKQPKYFELGPDGFLWTIRDARIQKWKTSSLFNQGVPELEITLASIFGEQMEFVGTQKLLFDKSGVVWAGTNGFGLIKITQKAQNFKTCLSNASQRQLLEGPDGGIFCLFRPAVKYPSKFFQTAAPQTDFYQPFNPSGKIKTSDDWGSCYACFDAAGNGWSSDRSENKLYRKDAQTNAIISFPWVAGYGLITSRSGALLSVGEKGLAKFNLQSETTTEFPFDKPQKIATLFSYFLYEDLDGVVWIYGLEGLTKAVPAADGYRFEYFSTNPADRSSLSSNIVLSVSDDPLEPGRYLWVGTKSGLNRLDKKTNQFKHYTSADGLPDNVVYGILAENAKPFIWLSTNKGLCRFQVREETTKNFTAADGLQDNEFNSSSYLKLRDGTMIFGGVKGLTVFHPDSLRYNENKPQIHIVDLKINNQKFDFSGKPSITLSHKQNLVTVEFAALEFTNPAQNQYRYQLVGVDKDWVSLGNRNSIQFANLAPGDYTLKVDGSNNDGIWSEQPAELKFTILPPWWASWWAYLLYLAVAAIAAWLYYRFRLRQKLEHQEAMRLQELDDFKSRFFTNITHEFRTPLTVMLGMSEQLVKEEKDEPKRNKLGLIKRSGENLLRLVNQILDLAKLESNALKMNYIQGDILAFIKYIAESLHSLANAQNLLLRVESDEAKIIMDYDPERFLQIVYNLLSNAIKFTPSGGKVVLRSSLEGPWLQLSVSDTGAGIPPEELPHLFERFFQAKNQEHAKAGGTGIGLSLTRELVKAMGGTITVESTVGVGSTFLVKLPVTNDSAFEEKSIGIQKTPAPLRAPVQPEHATDADWPNLLLIEDNPDVVEYLNACLKGRFNLDFAYNGLAGIENALENTPDLVISDVMMPFKDGFEVLDALKNDERSSHIPVVLLTAKADVESRLTGLRRGADAYLSKPFHQEELLATVDNLLENRRKLQLKYQQRVFAPDAPSESVEAAAIEDVFLQKVRAIIDEHYAKDDFGLPQLCQKIGMSRSQLFRKMKALTDIAPSDLIRIHRLQKAKALLESGTVNVAEAAWETGFKDPSYFSKLYQEEFGEAPSLTRK